MAVKRIGSVRMPDDPSNVWSQASPGDVMSGAPGIYGQEIREAPGPIVTEAQMFVAGDDPVERPRRKTSPKMPQKVELEIKSQRRVKVEKTAINLRMPTELLTKYKAFGPGYQTRIVKVLDMFLKSGGTFTEA